MTEAQELRLRAYLDAVRPVGSDLRARGWPVELTVSVESGHPVVTLALDVDDTRRPIEAERAMAQTARAELEE